MRILQWSVVIPVIFFSTGCALLFGIKKPRYQSGSEIAEIKNSMGLQNCKVGIIDTGAYIEKYKRLKEIDTVVAKDFMQPMMIKFFIDDTLYSYLANCYVPGFPKLNWKGTGYFDSIPPSYKYKHALYYKEKLEDEINYFKILNNDSLVRKKYVVLVHWSVFTKRHSKELIKNSLNYLKICPSDSLEMIFINVDNLYL